MSVELDPPELHFKRPFNKEVSQVLRLQNPHSDPVAFKVKTTAPKQYCVRPNSGRIEPGADVEVQVLLQAMKEDPPPDAKCRDKFLVQTIAITADKEFSSPSALWSHIEQTSKSSIHEKKIRVQFLAADAATPAKGINGVGHAETPAGASPTPDAVTPHAGSAAPVGAISGFGSRPDTDRSSSRNVSDETASSGIAASLPSSADVNAQLTEAKSQISRLTQQLKEQGELRQRKVATTLEEKGFPGVAQAVAHPNQTAGVPLQYVALLCLISFILAWIFF